MAPHDLSDATREDLERITRAGIAYQLAGSFPQTSAFWRAFMELGDEALAPLLPATADDGAVPGEPWYRRTWQRLAVAVAARPGGGIEDVGLEGPAL